MKFAKLTAAVCLLYLMSISPANASYKGLATSHSKSFADHSEGADQVTDGRESRNIDYSKSFGGGDDYKHKVIQAETHGSWAVEQGSTYDNQDKSNGGQNGDDAQHAANIQAGSNDDASDDGGSVYHKQDYGHLNGMHKLSAYAHADGYGDTFGGGHVQQKHGYGHHIGKHKYSAYGTDDGSYSDESDEGSYLQDKHNYGHKIRKHKYSALGHAGGYDDAFHGAYVQDKNAYGHQDYGKHKYSAFAHAGGSYEDVSDDDHVHDKHNYGHQNGKHKYSAYAHAHSHHGGYSDASDSGSSEYGHLGDSHYGKKKKVDQGKYVEILPDGSHRTINWKFSGGPSKYHGYSRYISKVTKSFHKDRKKHLKYY